MLDHALIAVVSAINTVESINYLPAERQRIIVDQLIEKLRPFAEAGCVPAQQVIEKFRIVAAPDAVFVDIRRSFQANQQEDDFLDAIRNNDMPFVEDYLKKGGNPFVYNLGGMGTALHQAIRSESLSMLDFIIKLYKKHDFCLSHYIEQKRYAYSPAAFALKEDKKAALNRLINAGVDPHELLVECQLRGIAIPSALKAYLSYRINTLKLRVLSVVQEADQMLYESVEMQSLEGEEKGFALDIKTEVISDEAAFKTVNKNALEYKLTTYEAVLPIENAVLIIFAMNNGFDKENDPFPSRKYLDFVCQMVRDYLTLHKINVRHECYCYSYSMKYKLYFPREALRHVMDCLLSLHAQHLCAVGMNAPLTEFAYLENIEPSAKARLNSMLAMNLPRDDAAFSQFDYDYAVFMRPYVTEEEKEIYKNYCAIRLAARIFAVGVMNGSLIPQKGMFILILARVGDVGIFCEDESLYIARENFERLPGKTYTPRLFLPAPVVAPVNVPALQLK